MVADVQPPTISPGVAVSSTSIAVLSSGCDLWSQTLYFVETLETFILKTAGRLSRQARASWPFVRGYQQAPQQPYDEENIRGNEVRASHPAGWQQA